MFIKYWAALTALVLFIPNISFAEHVRTRFNQAEFLRLQFGGGNQKPLSLPPDNDGIHLAISPQCGQLSGNPADINAGIDSGKIRTIVSFGVGLKFVSEKCCLMSYRIVTLTEGRTMALHSIRLS